MGQVIRNGTYDRGYTKISNELINTPNLSAKAKSVLIYILSKPPNWETRTEDIAAHMADGIDGIKSAIKELTNAGYLVRTRLKGDRGRFNGWETIAYEHPLPKVGNPTVGATESGFSDSGKTVGGKNHNRKNPPTENPPLINTDLETTDLKQTTELSKSGSETERALLATGQSPSEPEPEPAPTPVPVKKRKSKKRSAPAVSQYHPDECRQLWEMWSPFFIQQRGDRDSLAGFVQGFDELIEQGAAVADVVEGLTYYLENKKRAIAAGKSTAAPPDGIRFFRGSTQHPSSYCLDALALKREKIAPSGQPKTWRDDPRFDEWLTEFNRVGEKYFLYPGWAAGDRSDKPDPERLKFWNFLLKEGLASV